MYFPRGDTADVRSLEFAVTDGASFVDRESEDTTHAVELVDDRSLTYRQVNTAKSGRYRISKTYITDTRRDTVLMRVTFEPLVPGPTASSRSTTRRWATPRVTTPPRAAAAAPMSPCSPLTGPWRARSSRRPASCGPRAASSARATAGPTSTPIAELDWDYDEAPDGNVLQTGEGAEADKPRRSRWPSASARRRPTRRRTARASLRLPFQAVADAYMDGWHDYLRPLTRAPRALTEPLRTQYNVSVMTIKAHEDKTYRGAFIASLTLPWGFAANADEGGGGYHFVWARDLYHQATAMLAAGDRAAADRAVTWLFTRQQLPDGTFPQNSKVSGEPDQSNLQLDEVAFPIVLAWQLGRTEDTIWNGVRKAADAIVARGPATPQERWEETGGYSNSTLPAMIAGLVAASDLARLRGDEARAALWLGVADAWQRNTENWMFTTSGPYGDGRYYVRIDDDGDPNDGSERDFGNAAGVHKENAVVDAGFLELVRLGVKAPADAHVAESLPETDASLATLTPSGRVWHRYTFDGYGERPDGSPWQFNTPGTSGRAWPLLGGERGEYEVANGRSGLPYLRTMANTANDGYMIPEQVWDKPEPAPPPYDYQPGKATGSASPLAWAMAQYVRLARAIDAGRPVETPAVVAQRYATGVQRGVPALEVTAPANGSVADGREVTVRGTTNAQRVYVGAGATVQPVTPQGGAFEATVALERGGNQITVVAQGADGGTNMRQVTVVAFGTRVGGFSDPAGDDKGPGTYVYPTNGAFNAGAFDLTGLDVFTDGGDVLFVARIAGDVRNPFGGDRSRCSASTCTSAAVRAPRRPRCRAPTWTRRRRGAWRSSATGASRARACMRPAGRPPPSAGACSPCRRPARSPSSCPVRRSAASTRRRPPTGSRCSATPRGARASASSGRCTTSTTGTTRRPAWTGSSSSASAAAPARSTSASPARTPTRATPTRST